MMRAYRIFQIKWYHLLFGLLGLLAVVVVLLLVLLNNRRPGDLLEDETDIVI